MNINKLSKSGAVETVNEICDGLKKFVEHNPNCAKEFLKNLIPVLDDLAQDDFFGSEGWHEGLNVMN